MFSYHQSSLYNNVFVLNLHFLTAPSGSPQSVTATPLSPTVLRTTWSPPAAEHHNGVILEYVVQLTELASGRTWSNSTNNTSFQWHSLRPHYTYQYRVAATTEAGTGPYSPNTTVTMLQAGKSTCGKGSTNLIMIGNGRQHFLLLLFA